MRQGGMTMKRRDDLGVCDEKTLAMAAKGQHDSYGNWILSLLSFIAEKQGEEAVEAAFKRVYDDVYKDMIENWHNLTPEQLVTALTVGNLQHGSKIHWEEDDEKYVMFVHYCGSGGRIRNALASGKLKVPNAVTKEARPWSYAEKGVNYYCVHSAVWFNHLEFMDFEYGRQFDENGNRVDEPCKFIIYKKPKKKNP
jgi:hypothetical protein